MNDEINFDEFQEAALASNLEKFNKSDLKTLKLVRNKQGVNWGGAPHRKILKEILDTAIKQKEDELQLNQQMAEISFNRRILFWTIFGIVVMVIIFAIGSLK